MKKQHREGHPGKANWSLRVSHQLAICLCVLMALAAACAPESNQRETSAQAQTNAQPLEEKKKQELDDNLLWSQRLVLGTAFVFIVGVMLLASLLAQMLRKWIEAWNRRRRFKSGSMDSPLFLRTHDLKDPRGFLKEVWERADELSQYLQISLQNIWKREKNYRQDDDIGEAVVVVLNNVLRGEALLSQKLYGGIKLKEATDRLLRKEHLKGEQMVRFNRMLLVDAYPDKIRSISGSKERKLEEIAEKVSDVLLHRIKAEEPPPPAPIVKELERFLKEHSQKSEDKPGLTNENLDHLADKITEKLLLGGKDFSIKPSVDRLKQVADNFEEYLKKANRLPEGGGGQQQSAALVGVGQGPVVAAHKTQPGTDAQRKSDDAELSEKQKKQIRSLFEEVLKQAVTEVLKQAVTEVKKQAITEVKKEVVKELKQEVTLINEDLTNLLKGVRQDVMRAGDGPNDNEPPPTEQQGQAEEHLSSATKEHLSSATDDDSNKAPDSLPDSGESKDIPPSKSPSIPVSELATEDEGELLALIAEEKHKVARREKAVQEFVNQVFMFGNDPLLKHCKAYQKIGQDLNKEYLQKLQGESYSRSALLAESNWQEEQFQREVIRPTVIACSKELKDKREEKEFEKAFNELLASVKLKHSWPHEGDGYNPEQHEDEGRVDVSKKFSEEQQRKVVEVLSPCIFFVDKKDQAGKQEIFLKAKVKTP